MDVVVVCSERKNLCVRNMTKSDVTLTCSFRFCHLGNARSICLSIAATLGSWLSCVLAAGRERWEIKRVKVKEGLGSEGKEGVGTSKKKKNEKKGTDPCDGHGAPLAAALVEVEGGGAGLSGDAGLVCQPRHGVPERPEGLLLPRLQRLRVSSMMGIQGAS